MSKQGFIFLVEKLQSSSKAGSISYGFLIPNIFIKSEAYGFLITNIFIKSEALKGGSILYGFLVFNILSSQITGSRLNVRWVIFPIFFYKEPASAS